MPVAPLLFFLLCWGIQNAVPLAETQMALPVNLIEGPEEDFFPNEGKELLIYFPKIIYLCTKTDSVCFQIVFTVFQHDILSQLLQVVSTFECSSSEFNFNTKEYKESDLRDPKIILQKKQLLLKACFLRYNKNKTLGSQK